MTDLISKVDSLSERLITAASTPRFLIGASIFRIAAGFIVLYQYLLNYHHRHFLFGPNAVHDYGGFVELILASGSFSLYALSSSPIFFEAIYHAGIAVTVLWVFGWHTRTMTVLTYLFLWSMHERNPFLWDGGDNIFRIIIIFAMFANLGAYFSLDAERKATQGGQGTGYWQLVEAMFHNGAILAFALQLGIMYGCAGLYKVQGEVWQNGTALYYVMRTADYTWPGYSELIYQNLWLVHGLTYATVAFQVSFPFMLFMNKYTRRLALFSSLCFHTGIALFMGLVTFSAYMLVVELSFITDEEYRDMGKWVQRLTNSVRQAGNKLRPILPTDQGLERASNHPSTHLSGD